MHKWTKIQSRDDYKLIQRPPQLPRSAEDTVNEALPVAFNYAWTHVQTFERTSSTMNSKMGEKPVRPLS